MLNQFPRTRLPFCLLACAACVLARAAEAQTSINSTQASVTLNATLAESLTLAVNPNNVSFTLTPGAVTNGSSAVAITTTWVLKASRSSVNLYSWFTTPSAALTDGGSPANNIASSLVSGQVLTGTPTSFTPFTQSNTLGTANGGLQLYTQAISSTNRSANRTDNLSLQINLANLLQLPAGSYSGVLTLQAQAL